MANGVTNKDLYDAIEANRKETKVDIERVENKVEEVKHDFRTMEAGRLTRLEITVAETVAKIEGVVGIAPGKLDRDAVIKMALQAVIYALVVVGAVVGLKLSL